MSVTIYALLRTFEAYGRTKWFNLLRPAGTATLTVYMMPYVLYSIFGFAGLYTFDGLSGVLGLQKCVLFSLLCVGLTGLLSKAGIN